MPENFGVTLTAQATGFTEKSDSGSEGRGPHREGVFHARRKNLSFKSPRTEEDWATAKLASAPGFRATGKNRSVFLRGYAPEPTRAAATFFGSPEETFPATSAETSFRTGDFPTPGSGAGVLAPAIPGWSASKSSRANSTKWWAGGRSRPLGRGHRLPLVTGDHHAGKCVWHGS